MANDLHNTFSKKNLMRAWRWITSNPEYQYKNYFRDVYTAYAISLDKNLEDLNKRLMAGTYHPSKPVKVYYPKKSGVLRPFTLLAIEDQIVYQAFANIIAEYHVVKVKHRYYKSCFGHIYAGKTSQFFYQRWEKGYKKFNKAIKDNYAQGDTYIASFDLTACYDTIDHSVIEYLLNEYGIQKEFIDKLKYLLKYWTSEKSILHGHGIPQGPLASGILSEVILTYLDDKYEKHPKSQEIKYLRYVDDIKIMAKDYQKLKLMLIALDYFSKQVGLFPQASKLEIHEIGDIQKEVKELLISLPKDADKRKKMMGQKDIYREIVNLSRGLYINDMTNFKAYISMAEPTARITSRLFKLTNKYPELYESLAIYLEGYKNSLPKGVVEQILSYLERLEVYQVTNGKLFKALLHVDNKEIIEIVNKFVNERWNLHIKGTEKIYDPLYRSMMLGWILSYKKLKNNEITRLINNEKNWWVKKAILPYANTEYISKASYIELLKDGLVNDSLEVGIIAAHEIIKLESQVTIKNIEKLHPIIKNILIEAKIINGTKGARSEIGTYIELICKKKIGYFSWNNVFKPAKTHREVERRLVRAYAYSQTDISAFVNILDVIDEFILEALYKHDVTLGQYTLGKIGSVLNSPKLEKKYPCIYTLCSEVHNKRLECDLSHPLTKKTQKFTKPIPYKYINKLRKLLFNAVNELISKW